MARAWGGVMLSNAGPTSLMESKIASSVHIHSAPFCAISSAEEAHGQGVKRRYAEGRGLEADRLGALFGGGARAGPRHQVVRRVE